MWRRLGNAEEVVAVQAGICITIPVGTSFQFRTTGDDPLAAVGVTMPAWPEESDAFPVDGKWSTDAT